MKLPWPFVKRWLRWSGAASLLVVLAWSLLPKPSLYPKAMTFSQNLEDRDGKLVHLSGDLKTEEVLEDPDFNVHINALKLKREVLMYQWTEKSESKGAE